MFVLPGPGSAQNFSSSSSTVGESFSTFSNVVVPNSLLLWMKRFYIYKGRRAGNGIIFFVYIYVWLVIMRYAKRDL